MDFLDMYSRLAWGRGSGVAHSGTNILSGAEKTGRRGREYRARSSRPPPV